MELLKAHVSIAGAEDDRRSAQRQRRSTAAAAGLAVVVALILLATLTFAGGPAATPTARHAAHAAGGLSALPLAARASVSAQIGAGEPSYRVHRSASGLSGRNPAQGLRFAFARGGGVSVLAGHLRVSLGLSAIGWGTGPAAPARLAAPVATGANVVSYRGAGVVERFTNGPLGLEQSFAIPRAPSGPATGPLTLTLRLAGNGRVAVAPGGRSLALTRPGAGGLSYGGLTVTDARGRVLASWLRARAGRIFLQVDARGARYPLNVDPFVAQGAKLTATEETGAGAFGWRAALSGDGNTAVIGGPSDNTNVGAAFVFVRSGSTWSQQAKLTGTGETGAGRLGYDVALSTDGNTALVGAPEDNSGVGAMWVFVRSGETWTQQGEKLTGSGETGKGEFGISVALAGNGNTAIAGGSADSASVGAAWIFTRSAETWTQQGGKLTGAEESGEARFGVSVALNEEGNTALVGGGYDKEGLGAVWPFVLNGSTWEAQGAKLTGPGETGPGHFGFSVALSGDGNTAMIGGVADNIEIGAAWPFVRTGTTWAAQGSKLTGFGETGRALFGYSVSLSTSGNAALIGGPGDNTKAGAAWFFERSGTTWEEKGPKFTGGAEESGKGELGTGAALSGDATTALAGTPLDHGTVGGVFAFINIPEAPIVVTQPATAVAGYTASLHATVNPNDETVTDCHFNYGLTTAYGSTAPCTPSPGAGSLPVAVSAALTGLTSGATYHFQIVATNGTGTNEGADESFTTPPAPEYGRCVKVAKGVKGRFSTSGCTAFATSKLFAYEWEPGPGVKPTFTANTATALPSLETTAKKKIACKAETATGEYTGIKTVGSVKLKITGCELSGAKCTSSGAAEGEILSTTLEGVIGVEKKGTEPLKDKIAGELLVPGGSGAMFEFACGTTAVVVRGAVLYTLTPDHAVTTGALKFTQALGKQKPESFEGMPKAILEASLAEGPYLQTGLTMTVNQVNGEPMEVNSVI